MVASFTDPVTDAELQTRRLEEREKASHSRKRTVPPPGIEKNNSFPLVMRLRVARANQLAFRYFLN
jgi:hypothetical protein